MTDETGAQAAVTELEQQRNALGARAVTLAIALAKAKTERDEVVAERDELRRHVDNLNALLENQ